MRENKNAFKDLLEKQEHHLNDVMDKMEELKEQKIELEELIRIYEEKELAEADEEIKKNKVKENNGPKKIGKEILSEPAVGKKTLVFLCVCFLIYLQF